jgi:hypothetical protein
VDEEPTMMVSLIVDVDTENTEADVAELCSRIEQQPTIEVTTHQGITFDVTILSSERMD